MRDPYEILGLRKGSSKDEVKRAYKKLAKQYHPDQYDDNPLKDLAEERMREVNDAYDHIMKNTSDSGSHNSSQNYNNNTNTNYSSNNNYSGYTSNPNSYADIRMDINSGNLKAAEQKLHSVTTRDAEWNYLMGLVFLKKGWYDSANNYITTAYNLNPSHPEYRNSFNQLNRQSRSYRQNYSGRHRNNDDMCDLCVKLWCADSLCECAGGDLIDCF